MIPKGTLIAPFCALALAVTACADGGSEGQHEVTVAALPSLSYAPLFLTAEKYAAEHGVEVNIEMVATGDDIFQSLATGDVDLGAGTGSAAFNAYAQGLPLIHVAPVNYDYHENYFLLSSTIVDDKEDARALADDPGRARDLLSGETIATVSAGGFTTYTAHLMLQKMGLAGGLEEVEHDSFGFPDHVPALAEGSVVASVTSEPSATVAEQEGAGWRPFDAPDDQDALEMIVHLLANTDWLDDNPEAMDAFMAAYADAAAELDGEGWKTDDTVDAVAKYTDLPPELIREARDKYLPADLEVDLEGFAEAQRFYMENGDLDYDELLDPAELWDMTWRDRAVD